jgi:hypothetical protein
MLHPMFSEETDPAPVYNAQQIIKDVLTTGTDPLVLERLHVDLLLHYLRPTPEHRLTKEHQMQVIDDAAIISDLLRKIGHMV